MHKTMLIIVSGPPGAGKTTLASSLSELLGLPLLTKDGLKEALFDSLGWNDRAWSKTLGAASIELLYRLIDSQLKAGVPVIVEANFKAMAADRLDRLLKAHAAFPVQIACTAREDVLDARMRERWNSGKRHPGHNDAETINEKYPGWSSSEYGVLPLGGSVYRVDTTDFSKIDFGTLFNEIKLRLSALRARADIPQQHL
ncbi:MAG TPA: AAA family ATPase [Candidatus Binatia bacterium]|jgi:predicted kinase|nr:AAA family ATPase [Candidatus Binatia bacterium]